MAAAIPGQWKFRRAAEKRGPAAANANMPIVMNE